MVCVVHGRHLEDTTINLRQYTRTKTLAKNILHFPSEICYVVKED